jgi:hypothetical protein
MKAIGFVFCELVFLEMKKLTEYLTLAFGCSSKHRVPA